MSKFSVVLNRLRSLPIASRNKRHPFELGNVRTQDRIQADVRVERRGQGRLLHPASDFDCGLVIAGGTPPGIRSAALAFRGVQRFFESAAIERRLTPWTVLGFMSDSMEPNGLAAVLHEDDESVQFINVTAGAFFHTLFSAYHIVSDERFEPSLPGRGNYVEAHATGLFPITLHVPASVERRSRATRFAVTAMRVTFFHELAHILRGHMVFLHRTLGAAGGTIVEAIGNPTAPAAAVDLRRRALETDADDFSGRFMARQFFKDFRPEQLSLDDARFRSRAFEVIVGVVLMYSWFAESSEYHSGSLRACVALGSMFMELGLEVKTSARWVRDRVSGLQALMVDRGLLPEGAGLVSQAQLLDLNEQTEAYRQAHMRDWLQLRPWGYEDGNPG